MLQFCYTRLNCSVRLAYSLVYRFVWDSVSGYTFANLKLTTVPLTLVFSRSPKPSVQNVWSSRLTAHSFSQPLENEPVTRMRQRRLQMITRPILLIRSRICKSTPGRISFELFRRCRPPSSGLIRAKPSPLAFLMHSDRNLLPTGQRPQQITNSS